MLAFFPVAAKIGDLVVFKTQASEFRPHLLQENLLPILIQHSRVAQADLKRQFGALFDGKAVQADMIGFAEHKDLMQVGYRQVNGLSRQADHEIE